VIKVPGHSAADWPRAKEFSVRTEAVDDRLVHPPCPLRESSMLEVAMTVMFVAIWLFVCYEVVARHAAESNRVRP
jgi:hypothetical protein